MAEQNVFEKLHVEEKDKADLSGVLEQLNLPPAIVDFVRKHQKMIYISLGVIATAVVIWSFYGSYIENKRAKSSSALTLALEQDGQNRIEALSHVASDFSGTDSALWANIELAQAFIEQNNLEGALQKYGQVRKSISTEDILYPLVSYGIAQVNEMLAQHSLALEEYSALKNIQGYESIGYLGVSRIHEIQQNYDAAVKQLEEYQGILISENPSAPEKDFLSSRIDLLKAKM